MIMYLRELTGISIQLAAPKYADRVKDGNLEAFLNKKVLEKNVECGDLQIEAITNYL